MIGYILFFIFVDFEAIRDGNHYWTDTGRWDRMNNPVTIDFNFDELSYLYHLKIKFDVEFVIFEDV